ncbi:hypothetical protein [Pseudomonas mosselii]|nr:hypothetical protein [Pseudomonas mosselii]MCL8302323.1 hypothetical protein [Pseudomonas mosselii]
MKKTPPLLALAVVAFRNIDCKTSHRNSQHDDFAIIKKVLDRTFFR